MAQTHDNTYLLAFAKDRLGAVSDLGFRWHTPLKIPVTRGAQRTALCLTERCLQAKEAAATYARIVQGEVKEGRVFDDISSLLGSASSSVSGHSHGAGATCICSAVREGAGRWVTAAARDAHVWCCEIAFRPNTVRFPREGLLLAR
jgi:hypothetical protein